MNISRYFLRENILKELAVFLTIAVSSWCFGEQRLITNDGREVLLNEDGTWIFASQDRYATTSDGRQIQLKPDGSWVAVEKVPLSVQSNQPNSQLTTPSYAPSSADESPETINVQLNEAFVEEYSEKAGAQSKNTRTFRYINFILDVSLSARTQTPISLHDLNPEDFTVTDDRGKSYDIISFENAGIVQPGQTAQLKVITDGAPSALVRVRDIILNISASAFKTKNIITLDINYRGLDRRNISSKH